MNFNAVNVVMFGVGAVLVYCAIKDKSPKEVVLDAFTSGSSTSKPYVPPKGPPVGSPRRGPRGSRPPSQTPVPPVTSN